MYYSVFEKFLNEGYQGLAFSPRKLAYPEILGFLYLPISVKFKLELRKQFIQVGECHGKSFFKAHFN